MCHNILFLLSLYLLFASSLSRDLFVSCVGSLIGKAKFMLKYFEPLLKQRSRFGYKTSNLSPAPKDQLLPFQGRTSVVVTQYILLLMSVSRDIWSLNNSCPLCILFCFVIQK